LLEGLVFAERIGAVLAAGLPERRPFISRGASAHVLDDELRMMLQYAMTEGVGVLRSSDSMKRTLRVLEPMANSDVDITACTETWEMTNLHTVATVLATAALTREETRGSHWREDFPEPRTEWLKRVCLKADRDGVISTSFETVPQVPNMKEVL
jgi:nicotinate-nucleotide pyrophosphorylase (carboxylating)